MSWLIVLLLIGPEPEILLSAAVPTELCAPLAEEVYGAIAQLRPDLAFVVACASEQGENV